jgi:hypothetical protein
VERVIWHVTMSLDGFIAGPNDSMDWVVTAWSDQGRAHAISTCVPYGHADQRDAGGRWWCARVVVYS